MKIEINKTHFEFLSTLAERLATQDNRATSNPVFEVRERRREYGILEDVANNGMSYIHTDDSDDIFDSDDIAGIISSYGSVEAFIEDYAESKSFKLHAATKERKEYLESLDGLYPEIKVDTSDVDTDTLNVERFSFDLQYRTEVMEFMGYFCGYYRLIDVPVQFFLTEQGANDYIKANRHNLRNPFVYVESAYRNTEIQTLKEVVSEIGSGVAYVEVTKATNPKSWYVHDIGKTVKVKQATTEDMERCNSDGNPNDYWVYVWMEGVKLRREGLILKSDCK